MNLNIAQAINEAARLLQDSGVPEARREAGSLLIHVLARERAYLIAHSDEHLTTDALTRFRDAAERRAAGEPLQYITGHQEFFGLDFEVTPDVLIPRPETELLVEAALELLKDKSEPLICDVGTGSGCIPIAITHTRRDTRAVAIDISPRALQVAARNAERHNIRNRLRLVASDCFAALEESAARFQMILSNPPYVAEDSLAGLQREVREHEPRIALTPGQDGLRIIKRLLEDAPRFLLPAGYLLMEIGFDQHEAVRQLVDTRIWTLLDIHQDLQGIPRTVALKMKG